ncbi:Paired amphipathic helix protein [Trichinella spiralis]|uniref:Paired amphipathic helix protein n=1 Tax=Trichinella spiralis TaxID=6334 RepID=A0ABR3KBG3_TRISP
MSNVKLLNAFIVITSLNSSFTFASLGSSLFLKELDAVNITVDMETFYDSFNIAMDIDETVTLDKVQNYIQNVHLQFWHSPHIFMQFQHFLKLFYTQQLSAFNFAKQLLAMFMGYPFLTAGIPDLLPKGYQLHETEKYIFFIYPNGQIQPISKKYIVDP